MTIEQFCNALDEYQYVQFDGGRDRCVSDVMLSTTVDVVIGPPFWPDYWPGRVIHRSSIAVNRDPIMRQGSELSIGPRVSDEDIPEVEWDDLYVDEATFHFPPIDPSWENCVGVFLDFLQLDVLSDGWEPGWRRPEDGGSEGFDPHVYFVGERAPLDDAVTVTGWLDEAFELFDEQGRFVMDEHA